MCYAQVRFETLKRKNLEVSFWPTYRSRFKFCTPGVTSVLQMVLHNCPRVLKHVVCYRSHSFHSECFELLDIVAFDLDDEGVYKTT
jgi:hypothetical protein